MQFPVTVTKGKDEEKVHHAPDLQGWLNAGWEVKKDKEPAKRGPKPKESKEEDSKDDLLSELGIDS